MRCTGDNTNDLKQSERDKMRYAREMEHYVPPPSEYDYQPKVSTTGAAGGVAVGSGVAAGAGVALSMSRYLSLYPR
jgi:hypothetical protein